MKKGVLHQNNLILFNKNLIYIIFALLSEIAEFEGLTVETLQQGSPEFRLNLATLRKAINHIDNKQILNFYKVCSPNYNYILFILSDPYLTQIYCFLNKRSLQ